MRKKSFIGRAGFVFFMITFCLCIATVWAAERIQPLSRPWLGWSANPYPGCPFERNQASKISPGRASHLAH